MKKIVFDDPYKRKNIYENEDLYNIENQYSYIKMIYENLDFSYNKIIQKEIKKKFYSYKSQDKLKSKFDAEEHITYPQLLKKLYDSNLECYYCNEKLRLVYTKKNETKQWSLERFDNNIGHYDSNTCISCYQCNIMRKTDNHEYFKMGKQMTIKKVSE
jgi:hypothetical protein